MADSNNTDFFDLLPDPILLLIFNKLLDAKSLCSSLLVSKRFASLVPEIDSLSVQMGPRRSTNSSGSKTGNFFRGFVSKLARIVGKKTGSRKEGSTGFDVVDWIGTALKNFKDVQSLKLELPCNGGEIGVNKTIPLLKWEASFGKELHSCVILGATSISQTGEEKNVADPLTIEEEEQIFSDEELKLRIIWIISCLIASSARHNLMKKVINCCPKLSSAVILDSGKQGKLCMNAEQIRELRDSNSNSNNPTSESQMGYVGNLVMKLWYVKELELGRSGKVMKGATMVVIRPDRKVGNNGGEKEMTGFEEDGVFGEAAMELMRKKERRVYRLEMNTF